MPPRTRSASKPVTRSSTRPKTSSSAQTAIAKKSTPKVSQSSKAAPKPTKSETKSRRKHARQESVDSEAAPVVKARKRAKASAKLEIFLNMPIEVFIEIAKHLHPLELVLLSRVSKFFRKLFMSKRTSPVWVSALSNVVGLPPCPKSLCEPQYAALLFTKTCSTCGQAAPRNMDPFLLVRLCNECRDKQAVDTERVTDRSLVFSSRDLVLGKHDLVWWCLLDDAVAAKAKLKEFAANADPSVGDAWIEARRQEVLERHRAGTILQAWLQLQDKLREDEVNDLKDARQNEIESRLLKLGWDKRDFRTCDHTRMKQWLSWVHNTKPLNDQVWEELLPRLVEYLKLNRDQRLQREPDNRRHARQTIIRNWIRTIRQEMDPLARAIPKGLPSGPLPQGFQWGPHQVLRSSYPGDYARCTSFESEFKKLLELDISEDELRTSLDDQRKKFMTSIADWQSMIEIKLLQMIPEDTLAVDFSDTPGFDLTTGPVSHPRPISELSLNQRKLIRADVIFVALSTVLHYYPEDFDSDGDLRPSTEYDSKASGIAKALLNTLGRPNASRLELTAMGDVFQCGRCHSPPEYMSWKKMIEHYVWQGYAWKNISESRSYRAAKNFTFVYTHDVEATNVARPLIRVVAGDEQIQPVRTKTMKCVQCARIRVSQRYYDDHIIDHIRDVHQIEEPEEGTHYRVV